MSAQKKTVQQDVSAIKPPSEEAILKVAKEIVVKFIEVGRLSPANFPETFDTIFKSVRETVRS
jgi:hypothetical protein